MYLVFPYSTNDLIGCGIKNDDDDDDDEAKYSLEPFIYRHMTGCANEKGRSPNIKEVNLKN